MDGFGSVTWWGFSPALDLEQHWTGAGRSAESASGAEDGTSTLNVLLVGSGDLRHVLTTMASTSRQIHFFLAESCLEVYARHLLFLKLLTEPHEELGLQEKVELFLELYGNSLVRAQTAHYLTGAATDMINLIALWDKAVLDSAGHVAYRMITDPEYQKSALPMVDLSALKFKERDFLEGILKFWKLPLSYPIEDMWDMRVRSCLGSRYDSREGIYDWDYHMKLQEMAPLVNSREYKDWRENGVAFKLRRDAPYQTPNKSLASAMLLREGEGGDTVARRGYWGDIISSPYLSFGISTQHKEQLKTEGGRNIKSSVQISEDTLSELISKLTSTNPGCRGQTTGKVDQDTQLLNCNCSITFLSLRSIGEMAQKTKFRKYFNIAYFSNSMVHHLTSGIKATFAPHSMLICESVNFMLDLNKEKKEEYVTKVSKMAASLDFKMCKTQQGKHHLTFSS